MSKTLVVATKTALNNAIKTKKDSIKKKKNITIGLSPTMGALHNGHKSLIEKNVSENDISIVSIFVNPAQFSPSEDLDKYPRTLENDIKLCESLGVDIIFTPDSKEIYDGDEVSINPPKNMGYILEGYYRPTHFSGVLQVVLKLFNLTEANNAYFGKKDAQQLLIIQKMVKNLFLNINIVPIEIVRDSDSLALSSRNIYLDSKMRKKALAIPKAIFKINDLVSQNVRDIGILKESALEILKGLNIDYMDFYTHDLKLANEAKNCIFLLAVRLNLSDNSGEIRLLDNLWLD